jgi:hypothetical protein
MAPYVILHLKVPVGFDTRTKVPSGTQYMLVIGLQVAAGPPVGLSGSIGLSGSVMPDTFV